MLRMKRRRTSVLRIRICVALVFVVLLVALSLSTKRKQKQYTTMPRCHSFKLNQRPSTIKINGKMQYDIRIPLNERAVFSSNRHKLRISDVDKFSNEPNEGKLKRNILEHEKDNSLRKTYIRQMHDNFHMKNRQMIKQNTSDSRKAKSFDDVPNDPLLIESIDRDIANNMKDILENVNLNKSVIKEDLYSIKGRNNNASKRHQYIVRRHRRGSAIVTKDNNPTNATMAEIADIFISECPFADFCFEKATGILYEHEASCCKPCYCDKDCGKRLDCCFNSLDGYKEVTTFKLECITPAISSRNDSEIKTRDYYMIDSCLTDKKNDCMNKTVAEWGSFFPVYSYTSDKIYLNKHCAECNNINDSVSWNVSLSCKYGLELSFTNTLLIESLSGGACEILFLPFDEGTMEKFSCHKNQIKQCNVTGEWEKYDPFILEACENTNAPVTNYHDDDVFANVFCKLCNQAAHYPFQVCQKYQHDHKSPSFTSFAVMLDLDVLNAAKKESDGDDGINENGNCGESQVKHPYKDECREILCPVAYIRTPEGCTIYATRWYVDGYRLFLDLTAVSETLLPLASMLRLSDTEILGILEENGMPTDGHLIMAETTTDLHQIQYIRSFSMIVTGGEFPVDGGHVIETVTKSLMQDWKILVDNKTYVCKASLSRRAEPQLTGSFGVKPYKNLTYISSYNALDSVLLLNRLYFCEHVELQPDEYRWNMNRSFELTLIGTEKEKVLYGLEFTLEINENADTKVQICIEEFYSQIRQNNRGSSLKSYQIFLNMSLIYCFCKFTEIVSKHLLW